MVRQVCESAACPPFSFHSPAVSGETGRITTCTACVSPELRGCLQRNGLDPLMSRHLGGQSCEDVSGESGHPSQGISNLRAARMSEAKRTTSLGSGHLRSQSCENVSGETSWANTGQGISEVRVAGMSGAKAAGPPQLRTFRNQELRGCLRRNWPDHQGAGHVRGQGARISQAKVARPQWGISEIRVARMSQAKAA